VVGAHAEPILPTLMMSVWGAIHCLVLPALAMGWDLTLVRRIFPHFRLSREKDVGAALLWPKTRACACGALLLPRDVQDSNLPSTEPLHHPNRMKRGGA